MKNLALAGAVVALFVAAPVAQAATSSYNVVTTWFEPETQPNDSIFKGTFSYDSVTHVVSALQGVLSESMTGDGVGYPNDSMTWLTLGNQLFSSYDATLGGTLAAAFGNGDTRTFWAEAGGDAWTPAAGVATGGTFSGWPDKTANPGNAYALIFVPDNPLTPLTQAQIDKLAYADCAPGGMMGSTCMTGTSMAGYGATGTMGGYPLSQTITAAVPEPETYAMMMAGLGMIGFMARRRRTA